MLLTGPSKIFKTENFLTKKVLIPYGFYCIDSLFSVTPGCENPKRWEFLNEWARSKNGKVGKKGKVPLFRVLQLSPFRPGRINAELLGKFPFFRLEGIRRRLFWRENEATKTFFSRKNYKEIFSVKKGKDHLRKNSGSYEAN